MAGRRRVAVLISGGGSNLQALIDAEGTTPGWPAQAALVVSDRPGAFGLVRAGRAGIPARTVDRAAFPSREAFEAELDRALRDAGVEIVCLAGFMRVLTPPFVETWRDRMLNIHPSLLPAFPGLRTHERALAAGAAAHGCTVHLVRAALDDGPVVVQGLVPVLPGDDPEALAARVLEVEHRCYPRALALLASGRVTVRDERAAVRGETAGERLVLHPLLLAGGSP